MEELKKIIHMYLIETVKLIHISIDKQNSDTKPKQTNIN